MPEWKERKDMRKKGIAILICVLLCISLFSSCAMGNTAKTVQEDSVAMGSVVSLKLYGGEEKQMQETAKEALSKVSALDTQYLSKTLQTAALYKLNHAEHETPTFVPEPLLSALLKTKEVYAESFGAAALSSGALTELWGMDTDEFHVPSAEEIEAAQQLCGDAQVHFAEDGKVSYPKGQILNLGSVGKGMACEEAMTYLKAEMQNGTLQGAVISVGGSIGTIGTPAPKDAFEIGIRDPFGNPNAYFASLRLGEGYLSTSGTYEKQFQENGKTYHHLLDLRTGYPKESDLVSVTVLAPEGLLSDALSTLCFLLGEEASLPVLTQYGAEAVFVYKDKAVHLTEGLAEKFTLRDNSFKAVSIS